MALKRILSLLLLFSMTLSALCGCGIIILRDPYATEGPALTPETDTPPSSGNSPGKRPSGEDAAHQYTSVNYSPIIKEYIKSIDTVVYDSLGFFIVSPADAPVRLDTGEDTALSKAVHDRNQIVEKTLGVRLFFQFADSALMIEELKKAESSGFYYADLVAFPSTDTGSFVSSGTLLNLRSVLYLDLTADYFNESSVNAASAGIHTYAVAGAATLDIDSLPALYFNRRITDNAKLPSPYDQVYDGEWTWETLLLATAVLADQGLTPILTGDLADRAAQCIYTSFGAQAVRCGIKETPVLTLSETNADLLKTLGSLLSCTAAYTPASDTDLTAADLFFESGSSVFFLDTLKESAFHTTSATQWGLLPIPKLTEEQSAYMTPVSSDALLFAVPRTTGEIAATGRVLSVLNAASYGVFIGLEADRRLETAFRDNDSAAMFVKIANSATYNFLEILGTLDTSMAVEANSILTEGALAPESFPSAFADRLAALEGKLSALFPAT